MSRLVVDAGICGFQSVVEARKLEKDTVSVTIKSDCKQVSKLNEMLPVLELRDIFLPPNGNIVFHLAGQTDCHTSCAVPIAIIKSVEVEMGMALPRNVSIKFES